MMHENSNSRGAVARRPELREVVGQTARLIRVLCNKNRVRHCGRVCRWILLEVQVDMSEPQPVIVNSSKSVVLVVNISSSLYLSVVGTGSQK